MATAKKAPVRVVTAGGAVLQAAVTQKPALARARGTGSQAVLLSQQGGVPAQFKAQVSTLERHPAPGALDPQPSCWTVGEGGARARVGVDPSPRGRGSSARPGLG